MFSKKITNSDEFVKLSSSAQALYFHINQEADDDGFNNQIEMAMYKAHASSDDLIALLGKNFIIRFESGVIVIKHWRMHNAIRKDRHNPTNYQEELKQLNIKPNGAYTFKETVGCHLVAKRLPQVRLGKDSIGKDKDDDQSTHACEEVEKILNRTLSPLEMTTMEGVVDEYGLDVLLDALKIAVEKTNKNPFNYARAILENAKSGKRASKKEVNEIEIPETTGSKWLDNFLQNYEEN